MREILFRGKTEQGEWVYGVYYKQDHYYNEKDEKHCIITSTDTLGNDMDLDFCDVILETIGQFTGLTDKNGRKIFEGDIVKTKEFGKDSGNGVNFNNFDIFEVIYSSVSFKLNNSRRLFNMVTGQNFEVIGNIHDNKELLGE